MTSCCGEPECTRKQPIGIYLGDFDGKVYVALSRRLVAERPDGTATYAATDKHDVTTAMREFIRRNPTFVREALGESGWLTYGPGAVGGSGNLPQGGAGGGGGGNAGNSTPPGGGGGGGIGWAPR